MQPTAWIKSQLERASSDDGEFDPMNPDHFSKHEISENRLSLMQDTKTLQRDINDVQEKRREIIEKAVDKNKWEQKRLAMQADTLLKKAKILQKRYIVKQRYLTLVTIIQQMREMVQDVGEDINKSKIERLLQSGQLNPTEVGTEIQQELLQIGVDMEIVQDVIDELDMDIVLPEIESDIEQGESFELIKKLEEGELGRDDIDARLKEQHRQEDEDLSVEPEMDIPEPEIREGAGIDSLGQ